MSSESSFINMSYMVENIRVGIMVNQSIIDLLNSDLTPLLINYFQLRTVINRIERTSKNSVILDKIHRKIDQLTGVEVKKEEKSLKRKIPDPNQGAPVVKRQATSTVSGPSQRLSTSSKSERSVPIATKPISGPTPTSSKPIPGSTNVQGAVKQDKQHNGFVDFITSKKTAPTRFQPKIKKPEIIDAMPLIPNAKENKIPAVTKAHPKPSAAKKPTSIDSMFTAEEKRRRMERIQREAIEKKQKDAEAMSNMESFRLARQKRIEQAQKAKVSGKPLRDVKINIDYSKGF